MLPSWSTTHYVTTLATLSLLLACSSSTVPQDTEGGSSEGTTAAETTQNPTLPTTGGTASTDEPATTTVGTGEVSTTAEPNTTSDDSTSAGTTTTGDTTGDTDPGTSSGDASSSTGEPAMTCEDGMLNQDETDIDCGGVVCPACIDGQACLVDEDCTSTVCTEGVCAMPACDDLKPNGVETDVDCGGPDCEPCADNLACLVGTDCESQSCVANICEAATCVDEVKNGAESDIDCGGPECDPCPDGGACLMDLDCNSGVCTVDICTGATCFDGLENGEETDIDCGGPACAPCQLQTLVINEIDYDQPGNDTAEFIELFNNTGAPVNLANLEVRLINGSNKALYGTIKLGPGMLAQGQYLVIAPAGFVVPPGTAFIPSAAVLQNGDPDGLALVDISNKVVLDAFSYGGAITEAVLGAPFVGSTSLVEGQAANLKDNSDPSRSLARVPNGNDKNDALTDWASTVNVTPGAANQP
jgi:hypothetical protein